MRRTLNFKRNLRIGDFKMALSSQNIETLVQKLGSSSLFTLKKTLTSVARITKRPKEAELFRKNGGLARLLALLKRPNHSIIDMAMSALANCSVFLECKKEIRQLDGILPIVSVLKNLKTTSILNRAARALANLGEDNDNAMIMEELGAVEELAKLLDETTDPDSQQSVLRGLKLICTTPSRKKIIVEQGCVKTMIELLKSDKPALQSCSIKTVCELTKNCSKELALQIQEFDGIKEIIKLANSEKHSVSSAAVMSTVNLSVHAHVRVSIGSEGGISILYKQAKLNSSIHLTLKALEGLCYCCREAVNRNRVYECGAIELLLKHFSDPENHSLQRKIITAFNCFYYNEKCLEFLLNGGVVAALLSYLTKVIKTCQVVDHCVDDNDHYDHESFTSDFSSPSASPRNMTPVGIEASNISLNETFLEEATKLAMQVRDTKESNRVLTFKRKRTKTASTPSPSAKSIDQSSVLFSFSLLDCTTETTSLMSTCTLSTRTATTPFTPIHSHPRTVICSTPLPREDNANTSSEEFSTSVVLGKTLIDKCESSQLSPNPQSNITLALKESPKTSPISSPSNASITGEHSPKVVTLAPPSLSPSKSDGLIVSHHTVHGPGHSALVLLSRFSQMCDQKGQQYLLTKPCMKVLLDYLSLIDNPSPKCAQLLNYLTMDPQCFESLVCMGVACDMHRQLCHGWIYSCNYDDESEVSSNKAEVNAGNGVMDHDVHLSSGTDKQEFFYEQIPESSKQRCKSVGRKLLDNLICQSQTPFAKGVLMHLLSKASGDEWLGCLVTLPFVCRSKKLQQQMLVTKGGLKMLCDVLLTPCSDKVFGMAVYSLSFLSVETELDLVVPVSNVPQLTDSDSQGVQEESQHGLKRGKRKLFDDSNSIDDCNKKAKCQKQSNTEVGFHQEESFPSVCREETTCKYHHNENGPYDIQLEIDSGIQIPVHRCVLAKASDMFAAMLSSNYKEGSMPVISLKEITYNALILAVHKAYGCAFPGLHGSSESNNICCHVIKMVDSLPSDAKFDFLIEVLATADKFLMPELKSFCEHVLPSYVKESNILPLCLYAAHYHSKALCISGMKFLLLKVKNLSQQFNLAKQVFKSQDNVKLVKILHDMLLKHLQEKPM